MTIFPTRILFASDGSEDSELAATTAVGLAKITGSELHVLHVAPAFPDYFEPSDPDEPGPTEREGRRILDEQVNKIENVGGTVAQSHLRMGGAAEEVIDLSEELETGLIVLGSRGRGRIRRALMGSVSDSVVRHAHCPVMVVRWKPVSFPAKILLATDGSEEAALAAQSAADLAARTASELHVTHVGKALSQGGFVAGVDVGPLPTGSQELLDKEAKELLQAQLERMREAGASVTEAHLMSGRADEEIIFRAEQVGADLVVVGSRGLGGVRRALMGSVSDSVVRHAHCPVLVVRREGRQEPV
jgi:nucleotide-binding universal stress UspA family protein